MRGKVVRDKTFVRVDDAIMGFSDGHAAIGEVGELVGYGVDGIGAGRDIHDSAGGVQNVAIVDLVIPISVSIRSYSTLLPR